MSTFSPFARAAQARAAKQHLLPLSRAAIDTVALRYHANLHAMRMGYGGPDQIETLAAVLLLVRTLSDAGYGDLTQDLDERAKSALIDAVRRRDSVARWEIDAAGLGALAGIVLLHDRQMQRAPRAIMEKACAVLDALPCESSAILEFL